MGLVFLSVDYYLMELCTVGRAWCFTVCSYQFTRAWCFTVYSYQSLQGLGVSLCVATRVYKGLVFHCV